MGTNVGGCIVRGWGQKVLIGVLTVLLRRVVSQGGTEKNLEKPHS